MMNTYHIIVTFERRLKVHEVYEVSAETREDAVVMLEEHVEYGDSAFEDYITHISRADWEDGEEKELVRMEMDGEDTMQMDRPKGMELFRKYVERKEVRR